MSRDRELAAPRNQARRASSEYDDAIDIRLFCHQDVAYVTCNASGCSDDNSLNFEVSTSAHLCARTSAFLGSCCTISLTFDLLRAALNILHSLTCPTCSTSPTAQPSDRPAHLFGFPLDMIVSFQFIKIKALSRPAGLTHSASL